MNDKEQTILELGRDPRLAHAMLFRHRHHDETPDFHYDIIRLWHSMLQSVEFMAFRGAGKTTLAEEAVCVQALLRQFHNGIILGPSYERACERLAAIKHELETNAFIEELFGHQVGPTWNEGKVVMANGVVIQAFGRGMSLRGAKHFDRRPDCCFADDLEEEEDVKDPDARLRMLRWFMKVVIPGLAPGYRIRIAATPLHPESLAMVLSKEKGWVCRKYPIWSGPPEDRKPLWEARFPLREIVKIEQSFRSVGLMTEFKQEYECEAENEAEKTFTKEMFTIEPVVRTWHAVYGFYDPARSVKATSATTGWCYFSWIGHRLIVWDAGADFWKPDEINDHIFVKDAEYSPVEIGVEKDGLEEFLMQPLRAEMVKRGRIIPLAPMKAPPGKIQFIKSLQPFFKAREVVFTKHFPTVEEQFLGFPTGRIDAPNALAYALRMRPGAPVYDGFTVTNIAQDLDQAPRLPLYLAVNATQQWTAGALVQSIDGGLHVLADYVREGDPGQNLVHVVASAGLDARRAYNTLCGPQHFTGHDRVGLRAAAARVPVKIAAGVSHLDGQTEISRLLRLTVRGLPAFKVSTNARWTLNAMSGGYCREVLPSGQPSEFARQGPYRVLMEAVESFAGMLHIGLEQDDKDRRYATNEAGRRYLTARG
jgi:hypothetical protein